MGKIIAVSNQKGGVGKTTTSVNLAASMGKAEQKVLLIDLDPQGNSSSGLGVDKKNLKISSLDLLISEVIPEEATQRTDFKNLSVIPSNINLSAAEPKLMGIPNKELVLKGKIESLKKAYDYIFIDCPPSLGVITVNALCACDSVLVPIQCEFYALEGLSQLINTIKLIKRQANEKLEIEGILMTMFDPRLVLSRQVEKELKNNFADKVFNASIPRAVKLSEAPSFGKPSLYFDRWGKGTHAYMRLAKEILKNNNAGGKRFKSLKS